ncbi:unnamed protein product [Amoebophrya sp. A120]|nr:unnamed protein product [Amoebophrya sp. A120]|eukprot:GSA120T00012833001.1
MVRFGVERWDIGFRKNATIELDLPLTTTIEEMKEQVIQRARSDNFFPACYKVANKRHVASSELPQTTLGDLKITEGDVVKLMFTLGGAPCGPYPHQWINSITVNGVPLEIDRNKGTRAEKNCKVTNPVPCEAAPDCGAIISVQWSTAEQATDPRSLHLDNGPRFVNIERLGDFFGLAAANADSDPAKSTALDSIEREDGYGPARDSGLVDLQGVIVEHDSGSRRTVVRCGKLVPGKPHSLYTRSLGSGHVTAEPTTSIANYSCFRNPHEWFFETAPLSTASAPSHGATSSGPAAKKRKTGR